MSIELIKIKSEIGAGTRGSSTGIDAMEIAAINKNKEILAIESAPYVIPANLYFPCK